MPLSRRSLIQGAGAVAVTTAVPDSTFGAAHEPFRFGLTPVFLSNDLDLLDTLQLFLEHATGRAVRLVTRRTYQEITTLLVSGELDAAWICGYPFVQFRQQLSLVAVPLWNRQPLYQSYLIARAGRPAESINDLQGDIHAFSDPDSNSGYLVTRALLAQRKSGPDSFFTKAFFTYGHRNVIRAVGTGLANSGSVDGYVYEVVREFEAALVRPTEIVSKSEWLGFPPIACPISIKDSKLIQQLRAGLLSMAEEESGRKVLGMLKLDGFVAGELSLFDTIAQKVSLIEALG